MNRRRWMQAACATPLAGALRMGAAHATGEDETFPRVQPAPKGDERRRLLFAGSSSTYYHALPVQIAAALSTPEARCHAHTVGRSGTACYKYLQDGFRYEYGVGPGQTVRELIAEGHFDDLVLQISLDHLAGDGDNDTTAYLAGIATYQELAGKAGTRMWLYQMGWSDAPAFERGDRLLADLARKLRLPVVPCAAAWRRVRRQKPEIELHDLPDRTHPGVFGTYLNLAVFMAALTGRPLQQAPARAYLYWPFLMESEERVRVRRNAYVEINEPMAAYLRGVANAAAQAAGLFAARAR